jgi:hypothetical protein
MQEQFCRHNQTKRKIQAYASTSLPFVFQIKYDQKKKKKRLPNFRQVLITRKAISPLFAINTLLMGTILCFDSMLASQPTSQPAPSSV